MAAYTPPPARRSIASRAVRFVAVMVTFFIATSVAIACVWVLYAFLTP
jgi:hypothetical protein